MSNRDIEHGIKAADWLCIWVTIYFVGLGAGWWQ